ncbi:N-acetylmuramoyl-L-alanine amidase [Orrella sp. 11846]|uniref:N-acetylmuramoyl-L-alanine amidase n=1 Tax=Orrella sp. 11846 TaxID=3409913 RepID=UPI003B5A944D
MAEKTGNLTHTQKAGMISRRRLLQAASAFLCLPVIPRMAHAASVLAVRTWPAEEYTRVTLELDSELKAEHFTLDNPHRMVVDIQGLNMNAALEKLVRDVRPNDPYIKAIRVGQNRPDVVRMVLDLKQQIAPQVFTLKPIGDYQYRLVLDLYPTVAQDPILALLQSSPDKLEGEDPLAKIIESLGQNNTQIATAPTTPSAASPKTTPKVTPKAPVQQASAPRAAPARSGQKRILTIAIDPGHGGEDPGAIGKGGTREKDVVLAIAKRLKSRIDATPGMRAYLTRDGDYFVPLHVRVDKARRVKADLFVSVHADAFVRPTAGGSSVYVLSDRGASSTAASWLAKKENAADLIGGINLGATNKSVAQVLLNMSTAAQIKDSKKVGRSLLANLETVYRLHKPNVEQAGFAVLKAPDIPSVLVETAFISNPKEEKLLRDPKHQDRFASAIHQGISSFYRANPHLALAK